MPIKKIKIFLNSFIILTLIFYIFLQIFLNNNKVSKNTRNPHILKLVSQKVFPGKIQVRINDLDNNGDDEILIVSEQKMFARSASDQLYYYSNIQGTPNKILLLGKCKDILIRDIIHSRSGKEILTLETKNSSLFIEIFGYSGQFIRKQEIFNHLTSTRKIIFLGITDWDNDGTLDILIYIRKDYPSQKYFGVYAIPLDNSKSTKFHLKIPFKANITFFEENCQNREAPQRFFFIRPFWRASIKNARLLSFNKWGTLLWTADSLSGNSGFIHFADIFPRIPGKEIILTITGAIGKISENHMVVLNSRNGEPVYNSIFVDRLLNFYVYNDLSGKKLFVLTRNGYYYILGIHGNSLYTVKKEKIFPENWRRIKKVDFGNKGSFKYIILSTKRLLLLTQKFKPVAEFTGAIMHMFIYHIGKSAPPMIIVSTENGQVNFISYSINLYYYLIRGKYFILGILFLLISLRLFVINLKDENESSWESLIGKFFTEESKTATLVFDKSGKLIKYSSSAEKLLRNYFASFVGSHYHEFFKLNSKPLAKLLDDFFGGQVEHLSVSLPLEIENADMILQVELQWINHPNSQTDRIVLMMIQDVTELTRSHRLGAWIGMAQRIAHDIKTPLSTVNLTIQRLEMALEADNDPKITEYKKYIRNMEEEVSRIRRITNGFLKFVRLENLNKLPVNLNAIVQKVYFNARQRVPKEVEIELNLNHNIPEISGDEEQLVTLLENIIDNATHAIKDRGKITISTDVHQQWDEITQKFTSVVVVEIADTGEGMSEDILESIFQPFFTTRKEGVGLGLMISKEIVEAHRGKIKVQSKKGIGTNINLFFPAM